jgi:hypothetical protein
MELLLVAGGLTYKRARIVTGKNSAVITECCCAVAKVRHEREAKEGAEAAKRRDRNNWKRRCVSTMSAMGDRWAAVGNNRISSCWCGSNCMEAAALCSVRVRNIFRAINGLGVWGRAWWLLLSLRELVVELVSKC